MSRVSRASWELPGSFLGEMTGVTRMTGMTEMTRDD